MNCLRRIVPLGCLVLLALLASSALGQDKQTAGKKIDAATIGAYEKLGAKYIRRAAGSRFYSHGSDSIDMTKGIPAFEFREFPNAKLPDVAVPFALIFRRVLTDDQMKEVAGLKNLVRLELLGYKSAAGLKELARLRGLSELRLGTIKGADLKELAEFKDLKALWLDNVYPRDSGLKEFGALVQLEELVVLNVDLMQTRTGASPYKELAGLKRLHTLDIHDRLSAKDLVELRGIGLLHALKYASGKDGARPKSADEVTSLVLGGMTPANTQIFSVFKNLETLRLSQLDFAEPRVKNDVRYKDFATFAKDLAQFEKLTTLDMSNRRARYNDAVGLAELGKLKRLVALNLGGWRLPPKDLKELGSLNNLTTLGLADTYLTDADLNQLSGLHKLTSLDLNHTQVTNAGMKTVAGFKNLAELSLAKTKVRDLGVKELAGLKELSRLDLSDTEVTDVALRELAGSQKLTTLDLVGTRTTDTGIAELQKALPICKIER